MNRQWLYAKQPQGKIAPDTFQWAEGPIPVPREGEALVRTRMLSLDPANRAWMMGKTYRDALEPGQVMSGFAIGEVVDSKSGGLKAGDIVEGDWGWQDYAAMPARRLTKRTTKAPLELLIGPLSITGPPRRTCCTALLAAGSSGNRFATVWGSGRLRMKPMCSLLPEGTAISTVWP